MTNISFYGSHNSAIAVEKDGEVVLVVELERLLNSKNQGAAQYKTLRPSDLLMLTKFVVRYVKEVVGVEEFDNCYYLNTEVAHYGFHRLHEYIPAKNHIPFHHHQAHAAGCFYQSPFKEALVFSYDGGGDDGKFNIYKADRKNSVTLLGEILSDKLDNKLYPWYDMGFPYMCFGEYFKDIRFTDLGEGNLVYPGKIMGLAPLGRVNKRWLPHFIDFYDSNPGGERVGDWSESGYFDYKKKLDELGEKIKVKFDINNRLEGKTAYDVAATSQKAFEEVFISKIIPYIEKYPDLPLCITGGCGLNIILNTRIREEFGREVFVGPNPNDCGVAVGGILHNLRPEEAVDTTYLGIELLDKNLIGEYIQHFPNHIKTFDLDMDMLVNDLVEGKIVGVARGRSEHGPRALGNRSILCNPAIEGMKDMLNKKVKDREWYRPFAPVVRLEDVSKYFEFEGESRWMTFSPKVRRKWRKKLAAITHVDGSARVQTVTREQNEWLYDLLTKFEEKTGVGVLLNTSFNINGKPILSTVKDAFSILEKTEMDCIVIEDYYIRKQIAES